MAPRRTKYCGTFRRPQSLHPRRRRMTPLRTGIAYRVPPADFDSTLTTVSTCDGTVVLECEKMRNGYRFPPIRLQLDREALVFRSAGADVLKRLSKQQQQVLDTLKALCAVNPAGASVNEWRKRCQDDRGISFRTFYDAKQKLVEREAVEERAMGVYVAQ
jgi:hypothetical protein